MRRLAGILLSVLLWSGCSTYAGVPPTRPIVKLTMEHPGASQGQVDFEASAYLGRRLLAVKEVQAATCVIHGDRADIYIEGQPGVEERELRRAINDQVRHVSDLPPQIKVGSVAAATAEELVSATAVQEIEYADLVVDRAKARRLGVPLPRVDEALERHWLTDKKPEEIVVKSVTLPRVVLSDFAEIIVRREPDRIVRCATANSGRLAEVPAWQDTRR